MRNSRAKGPQIWGLLAAFVPLLAFAAADDLRVSRISLSGTTLRIQFVADTSFYYRVLSADHPAWAWCATGVLCASSTSATWSLDTSCGQAPAKWLGVVGIPTNTPGDLDLDQLSDLAELDLGTDPLRADTDGDQMPDGWEAANDLAPTNGSDAAHDADADGLSNLEEYQAQTMPCSADTDGDWVSDGYEIEAGADPLDAGISPPLVLKLPGDPLYARSTLLQAQVPGLVADAVVYAESENLENSVTNTVIDPCPILLQGDENGWRTVYARPQRAGGERGAPMGTTFILDTVAPVLMVSSPSPQETTDRRWVDVTGEATDSVSMVRVRIDGQWADVRQGAAFRHTRLPLRAGTNVIEVEGCDDAGNCVTQHVTVVQDVSTDSNAPTAWLNLPRDREVAGDQTNWLETTTYGSNEQLFVMGFTDDETAEVRLWVGQGGLTNGPYRAQLEATGLHARVALFPGLNTLCVEASDAAGNRSATNYAVVRDTNFIFAITNPTPYAVLNATTVVVQGQASPAFRDAAISVNGVRALVEDQGDYVTFTTTNGVQVGPGLTALAGTAELAGRLYYCDPPVVGYEVVSWLTHDYFTMWDRWPAREWQPEVITCRDFWDVWTADGKDRPLSDVAFGGTVCAAGSEGPDTMPSFWQGFACGAEYRQHDGNAESDFRDMTLRCKWRSQMALIRRAETQETQNVLFRFQGFYYGRGEQAERDPGEIKFRGQRGFWCGEDFGFVISNEVGKEFTLSEADFDVPSYAYAYNHGAEEGDPNYDRNCGLSQFRGDWFYFEGLSNQVLDVRVTPDFNHDRKIDDQDRNDLARHGLYHFWVNDDDDQTADEGDDRPGSGPDAGNQQVDSVRDLVDFFPLSIDLGTLLQDIGVSNLEVRIKHEETALKLLETDLTPDRAGGYLTELEVAESLGSAVVRTVGPEGVLLSESFIERMSSQGPGILLVEAKQATTEPLVVEVRVRAGGQDLGRAELALSISGVEELFAHKNLRAAGNGAVGVYDREASNLPDELCNGKHFVFLHGYSVAEQDARGWQSEIFKRMYWSGSNARFHGVTWRGDESRFDPWLLDAVTPNYHVNVIHALDSADELAAYLGALSGDVVLAAHSLGNMVASSAIQDYDAHVSRYFMIDAAVAMEAYESTAVDTQALAHCDWVGYEDRLWATEWHELFDPPDGRARLTWRGRFANVVPKAYNFYSSGEDVLARHTGCPHLLPALWNDGRFAWCIQEKLKGRFDLVPFQSAVYGGWDFNGDYWVGVFDPEVGAYRYGRTPEEAADLPSSLLKTYPLFSRGLAVNSTVLYDDALGGAYATLHQNRLLAEMFPALSLPAGANHVDDIENLGHGNFNMSSSSFRRNWPSTRENDSWLHSDLKNVGFVHVSGLFDGFAVNGGIR